ncbi:uncharacterized protein LOC142346068 [Convolutriloba macropyga]|uniref:uncharacterized protein LOC142346068 n=1 Tax=Convolutriloba macropyga TaxID=536237 RepID=UPI003F5268A6
MENKGKGGIKDVQVKIKPSLQVGPRESVLDTVSPLDGRNCMPKEGNTFKLYRSHSWWARPNEKSRELEYQSDLELVKKKTSILQEAHENKKHMNKIIKYHLGEEPPQVASLYQRLYEDLPNYYSRFPKSMQHACQEAGPGFVPDRRHTLPDFLFPPQQRYAVDPNCSQTKAVNYLKQRRYHVEKTQRTLGFKNITFPPLFSKEDPIKQNNRRYHVRCYETTKNGL